MEITDTSEVVEAISAANNDAETWRIETFQMYRESKRYGTQEVTVSISDRGPAISPRYHLTATAHNEQMPPEGRNCSSNSTDDLRVLIATTHWYQLDR